MTEALPDELSEKVAALREMRAAHSDLGMGILRAYDGALYPLDFMAVAVIKRSLNLLSAFCGLVEDRNFLAAAALLRLQLDSCLRFYAAFLVDDPHEFALEVLAGKQIRKLRARGGSRMTDRYLLECLSESEPWITSLYEHTSGFVHLSEKHIFATLQSVREEKEERTLEFLIGGADAFIPSERYVEAIDAFEAVTDLLLRYLEGWRVSKAHPELLRNSNEGRSQE